MKFHRTLAFTTLTNLLDRFSNGSYVVVVGKPDSMDVAKSAYQNLKEANIAIQNASTAGKTQGAGHAKSIFGQAWQHFSSGDSQLARNLAVQSKAAIEQTNSTSIPTQMPLPPVTAHAPTASNTTNLAIAAIAIAVIVVAILIWRFRRKKQSKV